MGLEQSILRFRRILLYLQIHLFREMIQPFRLILQYRELLTEVRMYRQTLMFHLIQERFRMTLMKKSFMTIRMNRL